MAKRTLILSLALALWVIPTGALADQACDQECSDGKVMASFADGSASARCVCVDPGSPMQETDETPINCDNPNDDGTSCS